jgi:triacylglycerol lipase
LIGFSMGALIARVYLAQLGGRELVGRFVSISGPHAGTWTAYGLPLPGVMQMRPDSPLLRNLARDPRALEPVSVHCLYTPFDAMIVPADSSVLPGARSVDRVPVLVHRWMLSDPRVLKIVLGLLSQPLTAPAQASASGFAHAPESALRPDARAHPRAPTGAEPGS